MKIKYLVFLMIGVFISCSKTEKKLPILGEKDFIKGDSVSAERHPHQIPDFQLINQDNEVVSNKTFEGKVYVADFFFTSCPTICPVMKTQMLRIYEKFKANSKVGILSHTIDPRHDSVSVLKKYKQKLGIEGTMWQFVTGDKDKIYDLGQKSYFVTSGEDSTAAGGFIHSGAFILIDTKRQIRGIYDGTKEEEVTKLINDISILLKEENNP